MYVCVYGGVGGWVYNSSSERSRSYPEDDDDNDVEWTIAHATIARSHAHAHHTRLSYVCECVVYQVFIMDELVILTTTI